MGKMLAMFRQDDVWATIDTIQKKNLVEDLHISWYDGKYDIGSDRVWDTWQIEGAGDGVVFSRTTSYPQLLSSENLTLCRSL